VHGHSVPEQCLGKQTSKIETVIYDVRAVTVAMQSLGKHVSTIDTVFSVGSLQEIILK
jgi:hypothetical protein